MMTDTLGKTIASVIAALDTTGAAIVLAVAGIAIVGLGHAYRRKPFDIGLALLVGAGLGGIPVAFTLMVAAITNRVETLRHEGRLYVGIAAAAFCWNLAEKVFKAIMHSWSVSAKPAKKAAPPTKPKDIAEPAPN